MESALTKEATLEMTALRQPIQEEQKSLDSLSHEAEAVSCQKDQDIQYIKNTSTLEMQDVLKLKDLKMRQLRTESTNVIYQAIRLGAVTC